MPASYTIRRSVPRNTRRSKPASTPSTCFPSFSINLFMAFPLPRGDLSSNTTNIIREQETPSPFGCGYAALLLHDDLGRVGGYTFCQVDSRFVHRQPHAGIVCIHHQVYPCS